MPRPAWSTFAALCAFAVAFGWIEGAVVVYLRAVSLDGYQPASDLPLVTLPPSLVAVEIVREACTLVVLGATAHLTSPRWAERAGAFLLLFGLWDLVYYATLRIVTGWPAGFGTWDILFLIPVPWVAPVWAPMVVATVFVAAGAYLLATGGRVRRYRRTDAVVLLTSTLIVLASLLAEWSVVTRRESPLEFPAWFFWCGVLLGVSWFARAEGRSRLSPDATAHG